MSGLSGAPAVRRRPVAPALAGTAVLLALSALLTLLALVASPSPASADALDDRVREIARTLRCPVCENVSVADSPSELAGQMRQVIREQLQQGRSRGEITAYFLERYGESILFDPPKRGFSLLAWVVAPLGLLVGGTIVWRLVLPARAAPGPAAAPGSAPDAGDLERYRARVRADLAQLSEEGR